jgi:hypothetical protein
MLLLDPLTGTYFAAIFLIYRDETWQIFDRSQYKLEKRRLAFK